MDETWSEPRRKKLCFTCKEPWEPGHRCLGKGKVHYIEVAYDNDDEDDTKATPSNEPSSSEEEQSLTKGDERPRTTIKGGTIATLFGVPKYYTFKIRGVIQGKQMTTLVNSGAMHNFMDATLVGRRGIPTKEFDGFNVVVADGYNKICTQKTPRLSVTLGNYIFTNDFS